MKPLKRILMGFGAVALVASLTALVAPKPVHAAVAALVQVTNNLANPVSSQDVFRSVAQMVTVWCIVPLNPEPCIEIGPSGAAPGSGYVVPAGQNLVITDVDIVPFAGKGGQQFLDTAESKPVSQHPRWLRLRQRWRYSPAPLPEWTRVRVRGYADSTWKCRPGLLRARLFDAQLDFAR